MESCLVSEVYLRMFWNNPSRRGMPLIRNVFIQYKSVAEHLADWKQERDAHLPSSPTCFATPWYLSVPRRQRSIKTAFGLMQAAHQVSRVKLLPYTAVFL